MSALGHKRSFSTLSSERLLSGVKRPPTLSQIRVQIRIFCGFGASHSVMALLAPGPRPIGPGRPRSRARRAGGAVGRSADNYGQGV